MDVDVAEHVDEWGPYFDDLPSDLLFECIVEDGRLDGGISVFRDRIVLGDPSPRQPCTLELEQVTGWCTADDAEDVLVTVRTDRVRRTRLPRSFHQAIAHALHDRLGVARAIA